MVTCLSFYIDEHIRTFNPPSLQEVLTKLPKTHPRILLDAEDWDNIIERNKTIRRHRLISEKPINA